MSEKVTLKDVHEMLAEICDPLRKTVRALTKQVEIERVRLGIPKPTHITWLDDMVNSERRKNGRN